MRRLRNGQRKDRANQYRKRGCRDRWGHSRVGQGTDRARVINDGSAGMHVDSSDESGQCDQHDAAHRHGGVRPGSGLRLVLGLHAGALNQYDATPGALVTQNY